MAEKKTSMTPRQREIFGILLMTLGMLILVSVVSYFLSPEEAPSGWQFMQVKNAMGVVGVKISELLVKFLLGYPAIVVPFLLISWGWNRFRDLKTERITRATIYGLSAALYFATLLAMPQVLNPEQSDIGFSLSGLVGGFIAKHLYIAFGVIGSFIILVAVAAVALVSATEFSLSELSEKMRTGWDHLREW
ncbi:MAG: DNA translocase FtsK 4TM domain-containing protein, partial [candidate division KSB1 bacterium]|nr:DNA translocase FtsK 4TM domain-containing protein [candidate division KSB1 bacterium]